MIPGRQLLASIDRTLAEQRRALSDTETRLETARRALLELQQADVADYRALAALRLDQLDAGALERHIDAAEQQVLTLLQGRQEALAELETRIAAAAHAREQLDAERETLAERVEQAAARVSAAEASTLARLEQDAAYRQAREGATEAERTAMHAGEKADESAREEDAKGASYRADPLFMYLWTRQHGTPKQRGNPLTRWLDAKVARLIGYADARANFARLVEIPQRLREHAETLQAAADAKLDALEQLQDDARQADGIPALITALDAEQDALSALDVRIATARDAQRQLDEERARFANGEDDHSQQAIAHLAAELARDDLMALRRAALATPFPEDDEIVARLLARDDQRRLLEASLTGLQQGLAPQRQRLGELDAVRADVIRNGYDRPGSSFADGELAQAMLVSFVNGLLDRQGLWRVLREQRRYRPPVRQPAPIAGRGGFGQGAVLGRGRSPARRAGAGRRPARGGGGGGFRTGGGF
jgi:hypothetical protein